MSFDKIFDLTAGVYFNFYYIHMKYHYINQGNEDIFTFDVKPCRKRRDYSHGRGYLPNDSIEFPCSYS